MPSPGHAVAVSLLGVLAGCVGENARVPTVDLIATGDTILAPYGEVAAAAWLADQRWVVVAPQDRAVAVADFRHHTLRPFAGGQRVFPQPYDVFRAGDSIYLSDWRRRQTTAWTPQELAGRAVPAVALLRGALPRARDGLGRWYFELFPQARPDGSGNFDSAAVIRLAADLTSPDTVARLSPLDLAEVVSEGQRRFERRLLSGQDRWGVLADGSIWVARVGKNRVDWIGPDDKVDRGDGLPDRVLPVTQADREIFLRRFDAGVRPTVEQIPFTAIKPPFEAALAGPDAGGAAGVWLVKSRAVGDTIRDYQVVDRSGHLSRLVRHRGLGQVVAVGGGDALVAEHYEGGVRLLRFHIPG
jgi:hypothetical protein